MQLAHFMAKNALFGHSGLNVQIERKSVETTQAAWSVGKLIQMFGPFSKWDCKSEYEEEYKLANLLIDRGYLKMDSLEVELRNAGVPDDCMRFIQYLLTWNPDERPTAEQALKHPWLEHIEV